MKSVYSIPWSGELELVGMLVGICGINFYFNMNNYKEPVTIAEMRVS